MVESRVGPFLYGEGATLKQFVRGFWLNRCLKSACGRRRWQRPRLARLAGNRAPAPMQLDAVSGRVGQRGRTWVLRQRQNGEVFLFAVSVGGFAVEGCRNQALHS